MNRVLIAATAIMLAAIPQAGTWAADAQSEADRDKEIREAVVERCRREMNAYGAMMVKSCVDMDIEAEEALDGY